MMHKLDSGREVYPRILCGIFVYAVNAPDLSVFVINHKRNCITCMCLCDNGCRVVGQNHNLVVAVLFELFYDNRQNLFIDKLNGSYLVFGLASVTALIGCLKMEIYKVRTVLKCIRRTACLALKVCVDISRSPGNIGYIHSGAQTYALKQVNCGNHRAVQTVCIIECVKLRLCALTPQPYGVGGAKSLFDTLNVKRML